MTANHSRQAHENALNTFGGQSDRGDGCDLAGGKSLAVAQPENRALSCLILSRRKLGQDLVELLELKTLAHCIKAVGASRFRAHLDWFHDRFRLACAPLCGQRGLEMIMDDIGRNHFQKSINGIFVAGLERPQQAAIALAELQVGILDQVVQLRA